MAFNDGSQYEASIKRLRRLAAAKRDEAEDELWTLCEDPAYFQETLQGRYQENCESSWNACTGEILRSVRLKMEMHSLQERTPPWQSPERLPTATAGRSTDTVLLGDHFGSIQPQEETAPPLATQVRSKPKTRCEADPSRGPPQTTLDEPEDPSPPKTQTFQLSNRAYKVMSALFLSSTQERTTGKILWRDFVLQARLRHQESRWFRVVFRTYVEKRLANHVS
ncbi:MAG: hypothetical protein Q9161_007322 [Pseudevernia consocians]